MGEVTKPPLGRRDCCLLLDLYSVALSTGSDERELVSWETCNQSASQS
jgi:hypothetical protein